MDKLKQGAKWNIINLICVIFLSFAFGGRSVAGGIILMSPFLYLIIRSFFVCNLDNKYFKLSAILSIISVFIIISFIGLIWFFSVPIGGGLGGGLGPLVLIPAIPSAILFLASFIIFWTGYKEAKK